MAFLEAAQISHQFYDGTFGIRELSFCIEPNEFIVLCGGNGSGKTILARHLNGLLSPTSGKVLFDGKNIKENLAAARRSVGYIFQDADSQILGQTVHEDVSFGPENLKLPSHEIEERTYQSLKAVGMDRLSHRNPYTLSGGEKRKLAIAGVLAMDPKFIIFDEPFSNLDYQGITEVLEEIITLFKKGHGIMVITHELEKILAHATRVIIMKSGSIYADGDPEDMLGPIYALSLLPKALLNTKIEAMTWLR